MTDLPPGWEWTTLGEIADTALGKMLDRGHNKGNPEVPYLRNVNVQWRDFDLSDVLTMELHPGQMEQFQVLPGDLLVCEGGEIGRCAIWADGGDYIAFQKAVHRIRVGPRILPEFLAYTIEDLALSRRITDFATGSTIKHLPQVQLRRLPILLPAIDEQEAVVGVINEYFNSLDEGERLLKSALSRISELPARFSTTAKPAILRKTILSRALRGQLL